MARPLPKLELNTNAHPAAIAQLNIGGGSGGAFTDFVALALGVTLSGNQFNPYTHDQLFLIAAYILEDVMVTAYQVGLWVTVRIMARARVSDVMVTAYQVRQPLCLSHCNTSDAQSNQKWREATGHPHD